MMLKRLIDSSSFFLHQRRHCNYLCHGGSLIFCLYFFFPLCLSRTTQNLGRELRENVSRGKALALSWTDF